jgi:hypothetical protein
VPGAGAKPSLRAAVETEARVTRALFSGPKIVISARKYSGKCGFR